MSRFHQRFLVCIAMVILLHPTLYDGWRHLCFVYPAFLFLAVFGWTTLLRAACLLAARTRHAISPFLLASAVPLVWTSWEMMRDHPYQNVWFNALAGLDIQTIKGRYELNYWGLSCRQGLEKLLAPDCSGRVSVLSETSPVAAGAMLLTPEQRARLHFVSRLEEADYYRSHYRSHRGEFPPDRDACTICVGNAKLFIAQKVR
jgi:hypothetical protein